ncbi:MAG: hypothetical protein K8S15_12865 [Candidatus Aegiribacteria sp.]|nr:hypothetical protein [Candidatus Aegiribacteria sp.]
MIIRLFTITVVASIFLFFSGCMGTFETARVVPLKVGATYFTTVESNEDNSFSMPGIIVETGLPAGPARFGIGLHLRVAAVLEENDDNGFMLVWGGKIQIPENSLVDIALGLDVWGYFPGEVKLYISRRIGSIEPYICIGIADFIDYKNNDIHVLSTDGLVSYTMGTMVELGGDSGWMLAAEIEGGKVWASPGVGLGLIKEF